VVQSLADQCNPMRFGVQLYDGIHQSNKWFLELQTAHHLPPFDGVDRGGLWRGDVDDYSLPPDVARGRRDLCRPHGCGRSTSRDRSNLRRRQRTFVEEYCSGQRRVRSQLGRERSHEVSQMSLVARRWPGSIDRVEGLEPVTSQRLQSGLGNVISPRVTGFVADDLAGAVDGEQRLELPMSRVSGTPGNTSPKSAADGRFMTVSAAAMINSRASRERPPRAPSGIGGRRSRRRDRRRSPTGSTCASVDRPHRGETLG